jgi:hypothetical protein
MKNIPTTFVQRDLRYGRAKNFSWDEFCNALLDMENNKLLLLLSEQVTGVLGGP